MKIILLMLLVSVVVSPVLAQNEPNDCVNAIMVCGNGSFSSNTSGIGNLQEVSGGCSGTEHNSFWLKIRIAKSGTLGFDLIPDDSSLVVDYDFWIFGPNADCATLGTPIRCCTTNPLQAYLDYNNTGMDANSTDIATGPGPDGNGYVKWMDVKAGESYYIAIDRPFGNGGFRIDWTGTAAFPDQPAVNQIQDLRSCSASPDVGNFNLNAVKSLINSDLSNNTITFHTTLANAIDGISLLADGYENTSNPQHIYAKVVDKSSGCFSMADFNLKVSQMPSATISFSKEKVCPGENVTVTFAGTPGVTVDYTLNGESVQSVSLDNSGKFTISEPITADRTYSLMAVKTVDGNNIVVCMQNLTETKTVRLNPPNSINGTLSVCLGQTSQLTGAGGSQIFGATTSDTTVATISPDGLVTGVGAGTTVITCIDNNGCSAKTSFLVKELPTINGISDICFSSSTQLSVSGGTSGIGTWVSSSSLIAEVTSSGLVKGISAGTVTITYTDDEGCSSDYIVKLSFSGLTKSAKAMVFNYFYENQSIEVKVVGDATYLYSLDGGPFQTSNVFSPVQPGKHSVTIHDAAGCINITIDDIQVFDYPNFFTPNNDGYNDFWNIWSLRDSQPNSDIFIFDRYGKLLKNITPEGIGWDGTYNGEVLPASDYWFTLIYIENGTDKTFYSHFALKR